MVTSISTQTSVANTHNRYVVADENIAEASAISRMIKRLCEGQCQVDEVHSFNSLLDSLANESCDALVLSDNISDNTKEHIPPGNSSTITIIGQIFKTHPALPIIILAEEYNSQLASNAIKAGAQEYLVKHDLSTELLSRSLKYASERKNSQIKLMQALQHVSQKNLQLEKLTRFDHLSGLPNQAHFEANAIRTLLRAARQEKLMALVAISIDKIKEISNAYGRAFIDEVILLFVHRAKNCLHGNEIFARISNSEFYIATDIISQEKEVNGLIDRLRAVFEKEFTILERNIEIQASIGVGFYPHAMTLETLVRQADIAMHEAEQHHNTYCCFFSPDMETKRFRALHIQSHLHSAIENKEFCTRFQKIYAKDASFAHHIEALAYWQSNDLGEIPPKEFISTIKNSPAIDFVTQTVIKDSAQIIANNPAKKHASDIHINIFTEQLSKLNFTENLIQKFEQLQIHPENICLEINESDIISKIEDFSPQLNELKKYGVKIALDNFGRQLSSSSLLVSLPIDYLKIDNCLVRNIHLNPRQLHFVQNIINFCHTCNIKAIAQGVESLNEYRVLQDIQCDLFQGFYFCPAVPHSELNKTNIRAIKQA